MFRFSSSVEEKEIDIAHKSYHLFCTRSKQAGMHPTYRRKQCGLVYVGLKTLHGVEGLRVQ